MGLLLHIDEDLDQEKKHVFVTSRGETQTLSNGLNE